VKKFIGKTGSRTEYEPFERVEQSLVPAKSHTFQEQYRRGDLHQPEK
jgi:hypothetical protein